MYEYVYNYECVYMCYIYKCILKYKLIKFKKVFFHIISTLIIQSLFRMKYFVIFHRFINYNIYIRHLNVIYAISYDYYDDFEHYYSKTEAATLVNNNRGFYISNMLDVNNY